MARSVEVQGEAHAIIARATIVTLALIACLPLLGLVINYNQTLSVEWWKVVWGPYAWFFVQFSGKSDTSAGSHLAAMLCIAAIIPLFISNTTWSRILAQFGVALWFVVGLSLVLVWT